MTSFFWNESHKIVVFLKWPNHYFLSYILMCKKEYLQKYKVFKLSHQAYVEKVWLYEHHITVGKSMESGDPAQDPALQFTTIFVCCQNSN